MDMSPNSQTEVLSEPEPVTGLPQRSRGALLRSVFREDRFFLVLSVFIGIFAGLAVVCFRFAIDWCRIYLLGSGDTLSPLRLLLAPSLGRVHRARLIQLILLSRHAIPSWR